MRKLMLLATAMAATIALPALRMEAQDMVPLSVKVLPPEPYLGSAIRFELNQPAYVAAFIVYPGAGVRLIYPEVAGPEQMWGSGYHAVSLISAGFDSYAYRVALGPVWMGGPHYLYVVASESPLDVDRFIHSPTLLQNTIGLASARSFLVDTELDALTSNAISLGNDATWDADSYMIWPGTERYASSSYAQEYRYRPNRAFWCAGGPFCNSAMTTQPFQRVAPEAPPTVLPGIEGKRIAVARPSASAHSLTEFTETRQGDTKASDVRSANSPTEQRSTERTYYTGAAAQEFFRHSLHSDNPNSGSNGGRSGDRAGRMSDSPQNSSVGFHAGMGTPRPSSAAENPRLAPNPGSPPQAQPHMHLEPPRMIPPSVAAPQSPPAPPVVSTRPLQR